METRYLCSHCGAHLNPVREIILRAGVEDRHGLVLLNPQPGNYDVVFAKGLQFEQGAEVDLACPVCGTELTSSRDRRMAELVFETPSQRGLVVFSRVYGKHATYVVAGRDVQSFGEDSEQDVVNFWGAGPIT